MWKVFLKVLDFILLSVLNMFLPKHMAKNPWFHYCREYSRICYSSGNFDFATGYIVGNFLFLHLKWNKEKKASEVKFEFET